MDLEGHIMELTQLRYFQTAAYYQHISRAACPEYDDFQTGEGAGSSAL